jgi:anaerobic selenocysteine-containing dehydrogenase
VCARLSSACGLVVSVENGRLTDVAGNPEHPFTQGVICGKRFFLNSSFSQSERLRRRQGDPVVLMAAEDAERRAIADGDAVRVWWHRFQPGGRSVNVVTSDRVADLGGGPAFHSTLVQIARLSTS